MEWFIIFGIVVLVWNQGLMFKKMNALEDQIEKSRAAIEWFSFTLKNRKSRS